MSYQIINKANEIIMFQLEKENQYLKKILKSKEGMIKIKSLVLLCFFCSFFFKNYLVISFINLITLFFIDMEEDLRSTQYFKKNSLFKDYVSLLIKNGYHKQEDNFLKQKLR